MTTKLEAQINGKYRELNRISMTGPMILIMGGILLGLIGLLLTLIVVLIALVMFIAGYMWLNSRKAEKERVEDEIAVLKAEMEDV